MWQGREDHAGLEERRIVRSCAPSQIRESGSVDPLIGSAVGQHRTGRNDVTGGGPIFFHATGVETGANVVGAIAGAFSLAQCEVKVQSARRCSSRNTR